MNNEMLLIMNVYSRDSESFEILIFIFYFITVLDFLKAGNSALFFYTSRMD